MTLEFDLGTGESFEINDIYMPMGETHKYRKVGSWRRNAKGKTYESPRIVLDRKFNSFIGKRYRIVCGEGSFKMGGIGRIRGSEDEVFFLMLCFVRES